MFYLVGSRFFGDYRPDSDYDLVGEDTPEIREFLERQGFKRLDSIHVRYHRDNLDVCLVENLEARLYARDNVDKNLPKRERHEKIRELINAYELGRVTK